MDAIFAALIGALAAGLLQTILAEVDRRRERRSVLTAIVSEVSVICELVRFRRYIPTLEKIIDYMKFNKEKKFDTLVDIRENYFIVFENLAASLGKLKSEEAASIVKFYALCRAVVDSVHRDGVVTQISDPAIVLESHKQLKHLIEELLKLGDSIVQFPKAPTKPSLQAHGGS